MGIKKATAFLMATVAFLISFSKGQSNMPAKDPKDQKYIWIKNWYRFQGKLRGKKPPWMKFYREILYDDDFRKLTHLQRLVLMYSWLTVLTYLRDDGHYEVRYDDFLDSLRHHMGPTKRLLSAVTGLIDKGFIEVLVYEAFTQRTCKSKRVREEESKRVESKTLKGTGDSAKIAPSPPESRPKPRRPAPPKVSSINLDRNNPDRFMWEGVTASDWDRWKDMFPEIPADFELKKAAEWCRTHPGKIKGRKRWDTFLINWLGKASPRRFNESTVEEEPEFDHEASTQRAIDDIARLKASGEWVEEEPSF